MVSNLDISPAGDAALLIKLGNQINPLVNRQVYHLVNRLTQVSLPGIGEIIPAYASLLVHYDPNLLDYAVVVRWVEQSILQLEKQDLPTPRLVKIPTLYGGDDGPDLGFLAKHCGLSETEVIRLHASVTYTVYMMGFTPGFAYLGGLPEKLAAPRLEIPRTHIRAGSVGIAGNQSGVYPIDSPGGWRIIGWTPLRLFDPLGEPPTLLSAGDQVCFVPISSLEMLNGLTGT